MNLEVFTLLMPWIWKRPQKACRLCTRHSLRLHLCRLYGLQPARLLCPRGFCRQEYWSGLPCPPSAYLPHSRIEPSSPESPLSAADSLTQSHLGMPKAEIKILGNTTLKRAQVDVKEDNQNNIKIVVLEIWLYGRVDKLKNKWLMDPVDNLIFKSKFATVVWG